jgi:hypothetical protein
MVQTVIVWEACRVFRAVAALALRATKAPASRRVTAPAIAFLPGMFIKPSP